LRLQFAYQADKNYGCFLCVVVQVAGITSELYCLLMSVKGRQENSIFSSTNPSAMTGFDTNPTKTLQLEKPVTEVRDALRFIPQLSTKYQLVRENRALSLSTFEADEPFSAGVFIDLRYTKLSETQTTLQVEVYRKVGTFNANHKIVQAHEHIANMLSLLSESMALDAGERARLLNVAKNTDAGGKATAGFAKKAVSLLVASALLGGLFYLVFDFFSE
jgi:hypothetical protein